MFELARTVADFTQIVSGECRQPMIVAVGSPGALVHIGPITAFRRATQNALVPLVTRRRRIHCQWMVDWCHARFRYLPARTVSAPPIHIAADDDAGDGPLRRILLALVLLGAVGLLTELALLEHFDSVSQWIPLALLVVVVGAVAGVRARRGPRAVRFFQAVMTLCVVVGAIGIFLHYRGNVEFELERDGSLRGLALFWEAIRGATPALAPGALSQLGLLGLAYTYRHPALRTSTTPSQEKP